MSDVKFKIELKKHALIKKNFSETYLLISRRIEANRITTRPTRPTIITESNVLLSSLDFKILKINFY